MRCDRLHRIEAGQDTAARDQLAFFLRRLHEVRGSDVAEYERLVEEILVRESYVVKQMVAATGARQSGTAWVDRNELDDVTYRVLLRITNFLRDMRGSSIGEFRNGVKTCVQFGVATYVRDDQKDQSLPVDPGHFTGALSPEETQFTELAALAASGGAEDRAVLREQLETVLGLEDRVAEVVLMRGLEGLAAKEVAERLGLTPGNVDQIYSRGLRKVKELYP